MMGSRGSGLSRIAAVALALAVAPAAARAAEVVQLAPAAVARIGIQTQPLKAAQRRDEVAAFAKVLDPGPLAQLISDLEGQAAAAKASTAEARRLKALQATQGAAAKDAEAAEAQAAADASKLVLLERRVGLEWGPGVQRLNAAQRRRLLDGLSRGALAIVHIDTPNNEGQDKARTARIDVGDGSVVSTVLGPARTAEPRLQSSGLIAVVSGPQAVKLSIGLTQGAHIETGNGQAGVLIPAAAVIRFAGSDWAYVQTAAGVFERRAITDGRVQKDGTFASAGFRPGEAVVIQGVAGLLTADHGGPGGR